MKDRCNIQLIESR